LTRTCRCRVLARSASDRLPVPTRAASVGARMVMLVWPSSWERRPVLLRAEKKALVLREVTPRVLERVAGTVKTLIQVLEFQTCQRKKKKRKKEKGEGRK